MENFQNKEEFKKTFDIQHAYSWKLRKSTAAERIVRLERLRTSIVAHTDNIAQALYEDLGRPIASQGKIETNGVLKVIDHAISNLEEWMAPTKVNELDLAASAYIRYESRGVVLLFSAWNFPVSLLFEPLVGIIAAGNTVIVKPNEVCPSVSKIATKILRETFEEHEVAVFEGGTDVSNTLLELPFDHIFFTGSPGVGRIVMSAAAKNLTSVTLELGGKSPLVLDKEFDIDAALPTMIFGKFFNDGQICIAPDYFLVPNGRIDEFVDKFKSKVTEMFYTDGKYQPERNTRIINERGFDRLNGYLEDAVKKGATIAFGGNTDRDKLIIEPTALLNVPKGASILENEIFGPIAPIIGYDDLDEAVAQIQAGSKPLALFIYSNDDIFVDHIVENTSSGGVSINGWAPHYKEETVPFGGIGESGMGAYHGIFGFRELSHARTVAFAKQELAHARSAAFAKQAV
jgi:aldehyde dehydrogenase (NAD+)